MPYGGGWRCSKKTRNCNPTLTFCIGVLRRKTGKAMESSSFSTATGLIAVNLLVVRDTTTWDEEMGETMPLPEGLSCGLIA